MTGSPVAWAAPCTFGTGTRLVPGTPLADAANLWHVTAWCCTASLTAAVGTSESAGLLPRVCRISWRSRPSVHNQRKSVSKTRTCPGSHSLTAPCAEHGESSTEAPYRPSRGVGGFLLPRLGSYRGARLAEVHPKAGPVLTISPALTRRRKASVPFYLAEQQPGDSKPALPQPEPSAGQRCRAEPSFSCGFPAQPAANQPSAAPCRSGLSHGSAGVLVF